MEKKLLEIKERFAKEFDTIFIEADCIIIEDSFEDTGCKNDDDCYDEALENANRVREVYPELEVVNYYCHRHKYAICELRFSQEHIDMYFTVKTSQEWYALDESGVVIYDPDGWDRKNYQFSFYEELISKEEYERRKMWSTCLFKKK